MRETELAMHKQNVRNAAIWWSKTDGNGEYRGSDWTMERSFWRGS